MLEYYWGPPGEDTEMNAVMQNDLARFDIQLKMQGDIANIQEVLGEVKYNDPSLLNIKTMMEDEVMLASGPALGMSLEDAVASMGGNISNFENANEMYPTIEIDGISMSEFCSEIVEITVNNDKYMTSRGIRIGDTIQTVEKLYGKPDIGFSGDDSVEYKSCYYWDNKMQVGFYRGLIICYKNGLISSFSLFQIILD